MFLEIKILGEKREVCVRERKFDKRKLLREEYLVHTTRGQLC